MGQTFFKNIFSEKSDLIFLNGRLMYLQYIKTKTFFLFMCSICCFIPKAVKRVLHYLNPFLLDRVMITSLFQHSKVTHYEAPIFHSFSLLLSLSLSRHFRLNVLQLLWWHVNECSLLSKPRYRVNRLSGEMMAKNVI